MLKKDGVLDRFVYFDEGFKFLYVLRGFSFYWVKVKSDIFVMIR